ncbi:triose-phosphate isomerase [Aquimarina agarilytica]|uniref:triose-phosphate isomerase n=1 Tax=Aquimarina agarilytica TaxID=1087449 RepID=UPI000287BB09|nr:triose-phosphate isomerase [Aquimarina agarilytica]
MRQKIVAGNWKMNKNVAETKSLIADLKAQTKTSSARVIITPSFVSLTTAVEAVAGSGVEVAAQNMSQHDSGAYTGEISAAMLKDAGVKIVLLGHSERRAYYGETDALLVEKVNKALAEGIEVIFCFGEELEDRKGGKHFDVVASQVSNALFHLKADAFKNIILAYEPVWAIGTGETATADQAQEMHAFIRKTLADKYSADLAESVSILYGGSCKPTNAEEIFSKVDVDGGLIGGASLKAEDFFGIINAR